MSISDVIRGRIAELVRKGELFLLKPLVGDERAVRELFVSRDVMDAVCLPWPTNHYGHRLECFRADFDAFTAHYRMQISEHPFAKASDADISRVSPVEREVWDFRSLEPPGIRCFGRFGGLNLFIALTWEYRENISSNDNWFGDDWETEISRFEKEWARLFGKLPLFRGDTLNDYLTNYVAV